MFFHFHVANIMAPGLMSYLCSPVPSSLALSELQCGLYALWLVTFSVSWSVYMSVQKKNKDEINLPVLISTAQQIMQIFYSFCLPIS